MKSSILIAAASMVVTAVTAQTTTPDEGRLYYSEPVSATVWTAGETYTVSWINYCKPGNSDHLDIVLYMSKDHLPGSADQIRVPDLQSLGSLNCLKNKSAKVTLPKGLTTGSTYSLHVNTKPLQSYSAQFTINGEDPVEVEPVATTTSVDATATATATATTAAPTATTSDSTEAEDKSTSAASGSAKAAIASTFALVAMAAGFMIL